MCKIPVYLEVILYWKFVDKAKWNLEEHHVK